MIFMFEINDRCYGARAVAVLADDYDAAVGRLRELRPRVEVSPSAFTKRDQAYLVDQGEDYAEYEWEE